MKTIFVTGGSSGIGYAIARLFLEKGERVFIFSRKALSCDLTAYPSCHAYSLDLSGSNDLLKTIEEIVKTHHLGSVDALINTAGIGFGTPLATLEEPVYCQVMDTNVKGLVLMTQAVLPWMQKGSVVCNISSITGIRGFPEWSVYCASKFAVEGFSKALREEVRARGIKVMVVRPGAVDTPLYHFLPPDEKRDFMSPKTIADVISATLFLEPNACAEEIFINNSVGDI